jgi:hypothetical protein
MDDPEKIELHDAVLQSMRIDYAKKTVLVEVQYYPDANSSERKRASIFFEEVESVSQVADIERLSSHASAGNINYWVPVREGTSYIYLSDGCVAVKARKLCFTPA